MLRHSKDAEDLSPNRHPHKVRAFKKAIQTIENMEKPITSAEDIAGIPTIGRRIQTRIQHFLQTGDPDAGAAQDQQKRRLLAELMEVPFLGPSKATELIEAGCKSVEHALSRPRFRAMLLPRQRVSIKYYQQLRQPVTFEEGERVKDFIQENVSSNYQVWLCGGHRRFASSDLSPITILLTHPTQVYLETPTKAGPLGLDSLSTRAARVPTYFRPKAYISSQERINSPLVQRLLPRLRDRGLIAETAKMFKWKWTGIVRIPEPEDEDINELNNVIQVRKAAISDRLGRFVRVEINLASQKSLGAALIALTGDAEFNRSIQKQALRMGMLLNEYGLWKWVKPEGTGELDDGTAEGTWRLLSSDTEEAIFAELGMEYVPPDRRGYGHLLQKTFRR